MPLIWIWIIVFALYLRTLKYHYVIDDSVKRSGYMYEVPLMAPDFKFFFTRPAVAYRLFMITMHCVNVSIIYMIWGWAPALLFAVHPIGAIGTAWVTGNYYATATYFTLIAFYFIHTFDSWWASLIAAPIFLSALYSTVCPITFPFVFLFGSSKWGLVMFVVLAYFFTTKKWKVGIGIRKGITNQKFVSTKFHASRLILMTKVVARYIFNALIPIRMGFFDNFGHRLRDRKGVYEKICSPNLNFFSCLSLCLLVLFIGIKVNMLAIFWFFSFAMLHSQWNLTGQFFALRYLYLAMIGLCVVVGTIIQPYPVIVAIVATLLIVKTYSFLPAWKCQENMWKNDIEAYPYSGQVYNNYAQYILSISSDGKDKSIPEIKPHHLNLAAYLLFKSDEIEPDSWEINMNIACFFARVGDIKECLKRTDKAISILEPLGGIKLPMEMLTKQRAEIIKILEKQTGGLVDKAADVASLSPQPEPIKEQEPALMS